MTCPNVNECRWCGEPVHCWRDEWHRGNCHMLHDECRPLRVAAQKREWRERQHRR